MIEEFYENDVVALLVDIPEVRLHRGDVGNVIQVFSPTRTSPGGLLLEFVSGGGVTQTDIDNMAHIIKLNSLNNRTTAPANLTLSLQEWAGASRIFALVFTDIVDSTALGSALGDEQWMLVLRKHFARARSLMVSDKCYEIKMIGDSFMVAFRSAIDALDFALAFHKDTGEDFVRIRAGIHVGPIRVFENDLFGMMVNYTKRVESTDNDAGFIVVSDEARNHIDSEKASRHSLGSTTSW